MTDSEGNLYVLGQFCNDSEWDGERLLPMTPYGPYATTINTLIAKISPEGEIVWKKIIHSNNGQNNLPQDIKKVGDTAFACLLQVTLAREWSNYTYYLDSLYVTAADFPFNFEGLNGALINVLVVFDFNGNVIEQHMLYVSYEDYDGNDMVRRYSDGHVNLITHYLQNATFDIDNMGNVYLCREANDYAPGAECDTCIGGIKFWVDRQQVGHVDLSELHPQRWYPQLLKFSPNLDTMLASRYMVQGCDSSISFSSYESSFIKLDEEGNIFHANTLSNHNSFGSFYLDTLNEIVVNVATVNNYLGYVSKFSSSLDPIYCLQMRDSVIGTNPIIISSTHFFSINFDEDSNLLFVSGFAQKNTDINSVYTINGVPLLALEKNDAFVLLFEKNTGVFHSACIIPSESSSNIGLSDPIDNLAAYNNRVFIQSQYYGGITLGENTYQAPSRNQSGLCLAIFDYKGNSIGGIDYQSSHPQNRPGSIAVHDSALFLSGLLKEEATFGNIVFPINQDNSVFVTKYVDSSFSTLYKSPTINIGTIKNDEKFVLYPNPANETTYISDYGEEINSISAITTMGLRIPLRQQGSAVDISHLVPGVYMLEIKTQQNKFHRKLIKL